MKAEPPLWGLDAAMPTIAALDLGSNTFRLMLAETASDGRAAGDAQWENRRIFQHIPRLSERLTSGGPFAPEALKRAWAALDGFDGHIRAAGAGTVLAGATMAARLAANGPEFISAVSKRYGWDAAILTGAEEAQLTAVGALTGLEPLPEHSLIFDIGGRSTEFISARQREIAAARSLGLGVVALTEDHLRAPASPGEMEAVAAEVRRILAGADFSDVSPEAVLVGTAGTVTTVAALLLGLREYRPELVNNARLAASDMAELLAVLARETVGERVRKHGLHPLRADAIVAGLVEILEIMKSFGRSDLLVSDNGLLEGLWLRASGTL
ncbi:MAG: hypothetical protein LBV79_04015 [Candidatus Adiutrix sp.]|jgi:exopolyphosphatase/guanosine-5'-triphosphate,3'-diphosphate pyrophosphatase|nr:hypothetical protein [Candidatus Adiutrix sp.]